MKTNIERLNELATKKSTWLQDAEEREKNKSWLKHSQKVAIKVLRTIRELGMTQKQLAEKMEMSPQMVNKIVKGKENLTFQTVAKLEEALGVSLIFTENNRAIIAKEYLINEKVVDFNTYVNKADLGTHNIPYQNKEQFLHTQLNEAEIAYGSKENKVESVGFQLRNIVTEQFAIIQNSYDSSNKEIALSINLKFGFNKDSHLLGVSVLVQLEQNKTPFLIIEVTNNFEIDENACNSFIKDNNKFIIPKGFASNIIVLTIGTLRGVLHCKTDNTEFNKFLLPTVNVTDLVKGDVEIDNVL